MQRTALLSILLIACSEPPSVDELSILEETVDEKARVPVSVVASGPMVEIEWSASGGSFDDDTAAETTWTAPLVSDSSHEPATEAHTITVTVSNMDGSTEETLDVTVTNLNETPNIIEATASDDSPLPGDVLTLSVLAEDGDDDDLTYEWRQLSPADKLEMTGAMTDTATVQMPTAAQAVGYEFSITVKDPSEAEIIRSVNTVAVVPTFAADVLPILGQNGANCGACHAPDGSGGGDLVFDPDDSEGVNAAYNALVESGVDPLTVTCNPDGAGDMEYKYVQPGQPEMSALYLKISRPIDGGSECEGSRMPLSNPGYFDSNANQLAIIESWILAGANND